jgi:LysM repeat protein
MSTPISSLSQNLQRARLVIESPKVADNIIDFRFNPTEYQLQKGNNFAEIAIPGLESPPIQFVRGNAEKLTVELLADTSDTLKDVRDVYVNKLRNLLNIRSESHAPPIVNFLWSKNEFRGVVESLNVTYVLFSPEGTPLRAKLSLSLKEYRPVEIQLKGKPKTSPDLEKTWVVRRGDKLSSIATAVYRDPGVWREIAEANEIKDPRVLRPGTVLALPRIR